MMRRADWKSQLIQQQNRMPRRLTNFRANEDGSLVVFSLFLIIAMLIIGGLGVDLMLYEAQRTRLQATLDRAVLAAAHPDQSPGSNDARKDVVMSYFASAGLDKYIDPNDVVVEANGTASKVSAQAKMHVDPLLLQLIGMKGFDAVGKGAAAQSAGLTEVSLIVDISGSMNNSSSTGESKISVLQSAAKQFVNILLCNPNQPTSTTGCTMPKGATSISLVPYERQVVVGSDILTRFNRLDAHEGSYCASFYPEEFETTAFNDTLDIRQTGRFDASTSSSRDYARSGQYPCRTHYWREIMPLSDSHTALGTRLDLLQAGGWTSIDIGLKWGVTMLDPSIRTVVDGLVADNSVSGSFIGRPRAYGASNSQKVIVLMTDGENTSQPYLLDEFRSGPSRVWNNSDDSSRMSIHYENNPDTTSDDTWYWPWRGNYYDHPYGSGQECTRYYYSRCVEWGDEPGNAYQMNWEDVWISKRWGWWMKMPGNDQPGVWIDRNSNSGSGDSSDNKDRRLLDLCDAAKVDDQITIYTIELETDTGGSGGSVLKQCATSDAHYFKVEGIDLVSTFSSIGQDIAKLRLTE